MEYTKLGNTDIEISKVCVGCMSFGKAGTMHDWTLGETKSEEVVKHALDLGINFFDTANGYSSGTSEEYIGRILKRQTSRDKVVIASKVYFNEGRLSKEAINREIDGTLRRLGTDYLDLYIIHRFDYETPMEETMEVLHNLVNGAGVSPSQAPIEAILKVDLYGTAVLLEEVGKVIVEGGCGVTISSQSGWRMPQLTAEEDAALATTPTEELLNLEILQPENIKDTLHAYQMAKRCNEKRVMAQSVEWGKRGARLNDIAPGIIVTPLAMDEFNGPRGDFYKNMFAKCPAGRPGTADEVANVAELLMSEKGAFITGSTFLIDGGATSTYYYGPLKPEA